MKQLFLLFLFLLPLTVSAQLSEIRDKVDALLAGKQLKAGVALCDMATNDTLYIRGDEGFPMQSVFKFPIALAILRQVDEGRRQLDDSLFITKEELLPDTWSPIRERYPAGNVSMTLAELIRYTVAQSDNNGCDILLRLLGGPSHAEAYVRSLGIDAITIGQDEAGMHRDWQAQYANQATPRAVCDLLRLFEAQRLLHPATQSFLWKTMAATSTGSVRTKLPSDAIVVHKTGSSGRNAEGLSAATNDAGILVLPDGRRVAYVIFITDSAESDAVNAAIIADLAKLLYTDYPTPVLHE